MYIGAWILAFGIAVGRLINAYYCFNDSRPTTEPERRADGNGGHLSIDFGGQWLMGRMLALGHGRELYLRPRQWTTAEQAFPRKYEAPAATMHDPELLIRNFMGHDDPRWGEFAGSLAALAGSNNSVQCAAIATCSCDNWSDERLKELHEPKGRVGVGGPLYPPIQAFFMLPFATGDHPQAAYFAMQYVQTLLCFAAGLGVCVFSRGRFWWPLASSLILLYPGSRGGIDLGQNSALSLTLLIWGWCSLSRGKPMLGGVIWGFLAYKPVWAISFLLLLLLIRQWRMAFSMALTGALLAVATLPFVGLNCWFNWLAVGQDAARLYNVDTNWIHLSRDVLGVPRRWLIDFDLARDERDHPLAQLASWALWVFVLEITLRVLFLKGQRSVPFTGPLPALLILATWMCTYHFMYYDAMISALGVFVLLADPRPFFRPRILGRVRGVETSGGRRSYWLVNSFVLTLIALMLVNENIAEPLKIEATVVMHSITSTRQLSDETTELTPRFVIGTGDRYPLDTLMIVALWTWCWICTLASGCPESKEAHTSRNDAPS